jgi:hypothetical protein
LSVSDHLALINAIISVASSASIACPTTVLGTKEDDGGETKKSNALLSTLLVLGAAVISLVICRR